MFFFFTSSKLPENLVRIPGDEICLSKFTIRSDHQIGPLLHYLLKNKIGLCFFFYFFVLLALGGSGPAWLRFCPACPHYPPPFGWYPDPPRLLHQKPGLAVDTSLSMPHLPYQRQGGFTLFENDICTCNTMTPRLQGLFFPDLWSDCNLCCC